MKRAIAAAAAVLALTGPMLLAAAAVNVVTTTTASAAYGYTPPVVVLSKSAPATYVNLDSFQPHDVTAVALRSTGVPMFASDTIDAGETSTIKRLATTPNGTYEFYCTLHAGMRGTAIVVS